MTTSIIPLPVSTEPGSITGQAESATEVPSEEGIAVSFDAVLQQLTTETAVVEPQTTDEIGDAATTAIPEAAFSEIEAIPTVRPEHQLLPEQVDEVLASDSSPESTTDSETDPLISPSPEANDQQVLTDVPADIELPPDPTSNLEDTPPKTTPEDPDGLPNGPPELSDDRLPTREPLILADSPEASDDTPPEGTVPVFDTPVEVRPADSTQPLVQDRPVPLDIVQAQSQVVPEDFQSAVPQEQAPESLPEQAITEIDLAPTADIEPTASKATVEIESAATSVVPRATATPTQPGTATDRKSNAREPQKPVPTHDAASEWTPELPAEVEPSLPISDDIQPRVESTQQTSTDNSTSTGESNAAPVLTSVDSSTPAAPSLPETPIAIAEPAPQDLSSSAEPIETLNTDTRAADPRVGLTSVRGEVVYRSLPGGMGEQVVAAVHQTLNSAEGSSEKAIFLELQPPELGRLRIRVEQGADSITTHIVASEASSGDLLSSRRDTLQNALTDLGFGDASVDISNSQDGPFFEEEGFGQRDQGHTAHRYPRDDAQGPDVNESLASDSGLNIIA